MTARFIGAGIGVTVSNFLYQAFTSADWHLAFDRSYFEIVALLGAWILMKLPFPQSKGGSRRG